MREPIRIVPEMILGTWRLVRTYTTLDGKVDQLDAIGADPIGFVHYMPDGRMAVLIAYGGRKPLSGTRNDAPEADWAQSARSFAAYAGTYTCGIDQVTHHLDVSLFENDNRTDYVRDTEFDDEGNLTLITPATSTPRGVQRMCLVWEQTSRFAPGWTYPRA